jgi:hypothetical protein
LLLQTFQDPNFFMQVPLQVAAERAISQFYYTQNRVGGWVGGARPLLLLLLLG